ncbi:MAG: GNAT family N-acetyltransferase [Gammaproteobacteria bacterium]|nr:GNAT family N-acetyltransferase [Gammaproteobacteria bacterium]
MPDPVPVMILARLAVARTHQGRGVGRALVQDALLRTLRVAEIAGIRAVSVHALDRQAAAFYEHLGFAPSPVDALYFLLDRLLFWLPSTKPDP